MKEVSYSAALASKWGVLGWLFNGGITGLIDTLSHASANVLALLSAEHPILRETTVWYAGETRNRQSQVHEREFRLLFTSFLNIRVKITFTLLI